MGNIKECRECQEIKSESKFYATDKNICKECKKDYARIRYHEKKAIDLEKSPAVMHAKNLEDRITELENRLSGLDILEQKITKLNKRVSRLQAADDD